MSWDLELILLVATVATGLVHYAYLLWHRRRRQAPPARRPWIVEWSRALFPVLALVLTLRAFVVEPFRIPSGSMMPTLLIGDLILVNKYSYGVRLPVWHTRILEFGQPERGDVAVFRFPGNPSLDYIKRVVALPEDEVVYAGKRLWVNGEAYPQENPRPFLEELTGLPRPHHTRYTERIQGRAHDILRDSLHEDVPRSFTVPPGHYLVMGDNRDHSSDSRVWGFVPENHLVGRAFLVWMNLDFLLESLTRPDPSLLLSRLGRIR